MFYSSIAMLRILVVLGVLGALGLDPLDPDPSLLDPPVASADADRLPWMVGGEPWVWTRGDPPGYPDGELGWSMPVDLDEEREFRAIRSLPVIHRQLVGSIVTRPRLSDSLHDLGWT